MKPLVVVDLISGPQPAYGPDVVQAHHLHTAPDRPLVVVVPEDDWAAAFEDAGGIHVTGSTWMLQEDAPWASDLCRALEAAAGQGVPVLGVCFGHQMLGVHFGARLGSWPEDRFGVAPVTFQETGPFPAASLPLVHTHRDRLTEPGPLRVVGRGGLGGVQAWAHPDLPVWGVQGHPEADADLCIRGEGAARCDSYTRAELDTRAAKSILHQFGRLMV